LSKLGELFERWVRLARRWFHIFVGLAFLCLAGAGALVSLSEWRDYSENQAIGWSHFGIVLAFTVFLVILSLYSFVRARSVR